ncbi:MAG: hypothetical protein J5708_06345 [Bacteroidales bacterium]|nr:hypothetical protein [Bacteroidales bacterium]
MKQDLIIHSDLLPEFVETNLQHTNQIFRIPTTENVEARPIRRKIIEIAYKSILSKLQGNNFIKNDFLNENVFLIFRESYLKASNNAARSWQSTYAILHIYDVLKYARPKDEDYITDDIKQGFQKNNHYEKLYKLVYNIRNENLPYMNFPVEVLLGRKTTGILVQYSIEHKKTVSKSMP